MNCFGLWQSAERSLNARRRLKSRNGGTRRLDDQTQVQTGTPQCLARGIAFQHASQNLDVPAAKASTANCESPRRSLQWFVEPLDQSVVTKVKELLLPVRNKDWL
jgi:hypothetical protein